mmetsp:Transcript_20808/g.65870  ORF Transcript_20808/g.65870 Transcript_20808/m.65870 type:complete len:230 (+) Transcript_20808:322-1011(+)
MMEVCMGPSMTASTMLISCALRVAEESRTLNTALHHAMRTLRSLCTRAISEACRLLISWATCSRRIAVNPDRSSRRVRHATALSRASRRPWECFFARVLQKRKALWRGECHVRIRRIHSLRSLGRSFITGSQYLISCHMRPPRSRPRTRSRISCFCGCARCQSSQFCSTSFSMRSQYFSMEPRHVSCSWKTSLRHSEKVCSFLTFFIASLHCSWNRRPWVTLLAQALNT